MDPNELIPFLAFAGLCGMAIGYGAHMIWARLKTAQMEFSARQLVKDAERDSEAIRREAKLHAKDEYIKIHEKFEQETLARRQSLQAQEERLIGREESLDRKLQVLDDKDLRLDEKLQHLEEQRDQLAEQAKALDDLLAQKRSALQNVSGLSVEEARQQLLTLMEEELRGELGGMIRRVKEEANEQAEQEARRIITLAIERYAASQVSEITTSTIDLPNEDMKGRIIGKEGRNVRALEAVTGVNIVIDDTPEVVVVSGFDPVRREVAKQALIELITDGRINPARIEEVVAKVQAELDTLMRQAGEDAVFELSLRSVAPEIVYTLGRLKFRHSYAQNVLQHSIEVGHLMGAMAAELGLDVHMARRIGLFHDIGKALDHTIEGGHALIGADLLKRHGEDPLVCNAVAAHHHEVEGESVYAPLTVAADAMTASRPGARSETTELYVKRLETLESIANAYSGVIRSFAIQAGREIRVIVEPSKIDDNEAMQMARNISKQIEQNLTYPGQIKVTVVRETRCIEYAR